MNKDKIELLAPAKNAAAAMAAIGCGADAVYIGAASFGARQAAGNSIEDIAQVTKYAHQYYARVYAAVNTLLFDDELEKAHRLIWQLYEAGVDGLIIQDAGLLEMELPPLPLIASTQMDNSSPEKVKFLEQVGFSRVILARELTLSQIRELRDVTSVELECFVHGAVCVSASGQCYMSYAAGGRSGNRGQCAQPCRKKYRLKDGDGKILSDWKYLLSLKDMNRSQYLEELLDAGVTSFKIEGRLKDITYVANVTAYYRKLLDELLEKRGLQKSSSGSSKWGFEPNPSKTFNRGFTDYALAGNTSQMGSIDTPKSLGERIGVVTKVHATSFEINNDSELHNGDGICFFGSSGELGGTVVNRVEANRIWPQKMEALEVGLELYRNYDHLFSKALEKSPWRRTVTVKMVLKEQGDKLVIEAVDEDGNTACVEIEGDKQVAVKKEHAKETIITQLAKLGSTIFDCKEVKIETGLTYFLAVSQLNAAKRKLVEELLEIRLANRKRPLGGVCVNSEPYPQKELTYSGNVLNEKARQFYQRHGVEKIEPAAESGIDLQGRLLMSTKHCILKELGKCLAQNQDSAETLQLQDEEGRIYDINFRCGNCGMDVYLL